MHKRKQNRKQKTNRKKYVFLKNRKKQHFNYFSSERLKKISHSNSAKIAIINYQKKTDLKWSCGNIVLTKNKTKKEKT